MSVTPQALGRAFWAICVLILVGCASGPDKPKPEPLTPLVPKLAVQSLWNKRLGAVSFPLQVASQSNTFIAANDAGTVWALQADTGRELWHVNLGAELSAGVGGDSRKVAVVSQKDDLIVLEAGVVVWRQNLPVRVITPPLVAGERVFVLGIDRSVHAFDALDGRKLWHYQKSSEALLLAEPGLLAPFKDILLVGQGAKLTAFDSLLGTVRWETALATPRGTNEVERLADLLAPAARLGDVVCARAFQAAVACVKGDTGALAWSRPTSGLTGLALASVLGVEPIGAPLLFGADASSRLTAWHWSDGQVAWTADHLLHREVTAPVITPAETFAVGDTQGFVHWLSRQTGQVLQRLPTNGSSVRSPLISMGRITLALTQSGSLFAFQTP
jgi:outer membrane protein assembly factor BamB